MIRLSIRVSTGRYINRRGESPRIFIFYILAMKYNAMFFALDGAYVVDFYHNTIK